MPTFSRPARQPHLSQYTSEFFSNAHRPVINGGIFTSVNNSTTQLAQKDGFQILQEHVAPAAFHNSKQRVDPPRCYAHTREAVLEELFDWIVGNVPREAWVAWLNGAAGAGKSAICQSMAEMCILRGIKVASFFFFRTDATRNAIDPVIATLAYQIIQLLPETKELIISSIESHPLIFEQTFATQLDLLIVTPIRCLRVSDPGLTLLLLVDGVDECIGNSSQTDLIHTFGKLLQNRDLPLAVLFCSRRESQIQMAFNARDMDGILKQVPLDNNYQAEADIRHFLVERFNDIKLTHPQRKRLDAAWPAAEHIQQIVSKSSGQFIYAASVVKFLAMPSSNPSTQLDIIRGLRPVGRATPFAELDALYRHIFSHVEDIVTTLRFLAYAILAPVHTVQKMLNFFDITEDDWECILAPLTSVLTYDMYYDPDKIIFHHASLPDFLKDKERSQEYCISEQGTELSILWFKNAACGRFQPLSESEQNTDLVEFIGCAKASPDLRTLLLDYTPLQTPSAYAWDIFPSIILNDIHQMDFGDDGEAYRIVSDRIVRYVKKEFPNLLPQIALQYTTLTEEEMLQVADQSTLTQSSIRQIVRRWSSAMLDFCNSAAYLFY
ncbi:hypothetical protein HYPSUDRAFT_763935 [Hypholoma sublateritium FD-334 SS-4]|uniref:Nephrocystin 3-like N-terminal domain-containing protein n=1 Tax=Hypholoma sublateritium (strain FD-334 SS-4) TaxID=945553 RepID=A0A0D2PM57_HYPSF|nr:hypothetical protein HYPSUDRAFT_763935 [Hypholoma sublateritium FD-334 SS-4]